MGLFTNRKSSDIEFVSARAAIDALHQRNEPNDVAHDGVIVEDVDALIDTIPDAIPDAAAPFADELDDEDAALALAEVGITLDETEPELPPGPSRRDDAAVRSQINADDPAIDHDVAIDIDVDGLLELLGVSPDASLDEISEARLRFLDTHDPQAETRADAAAIKERIRRQINTAYATFRLTKAG